MLKCLAPWARLEHRRFPLTQHSNGGIRAWPQCPHRAAGPGHLRAAGLEVETSVSTGSTGEGGDSPLSNSDTSGCQLCRKGPGVTNCIVPRASLHSFLLQLPATQTLPRVRGKALTCSAQLCPRQTVLHFKGTVSDSISSRTEALLTHIHCTVCLLREISKDINWELILQGTVKVAEQRPSLDSYF